MPVTETVGRAATTAGRGVRAVAQPVLVGGRWTRRQTGRFRTAMAGGERGMARLFDLHATSIAGDTLIAVGLAGTIFFAVPLGEARTNVALYLLVTMVPFAVLAPLIGPVIDHFRHGRRYALAATMLGRAALAWLIADHLDQFALYPAAFGVLLLSRAYGVARAATVPRLLPARLGLSQVNARGSVYGTLAGAVVTPLGIAAFWIGPQWPLRVASVLFLIGMVVALRLPAGADSDPPEAPPRLLTMLWLPGRRNRERIFDSRLVIATLIGSSIHRALYGFLLIFLAFALRADQLPTSIAGVELGEGTALGLVSGALVIGTFVAVAIGSRLRIHHPVAIQAIGLLVVTIVAVLTAVVFTLMMVAALCTIAAISSGLAKVAIDSSIQERLDERHRTSAFARSETMLMLAFVAGAAAGLIPMPGQLGMAVVAGVLGLAVLRAAVVAIRLRGEVLSGRPPVPVPDSAAGPTPATVVDPEPETTDLAAPEATTTELRRPTAPTIDLAAPEATTTELPLPDPTRPGSRAHRSAPGDPS